jgi:hypothetical protein
VTSGREAALRRRTQLFVPADEPAFLPRLTAHDACHVALAELLDATPMTADLRLARPPGMRCPVVTVSP